MNVALPDELFEFQTVIDADNEIHAVKVREDGTLDEFTLCSRNALVMRLVSFNTDDAQMHHSCQKRYAGQGVPREWAHSRR